jgi:hypothetical protein
MYTYRHTYLQCVPAFLGVRALVNVTQTKRWRSMRGHEVEPHDRPWSIPRGPYLTRRTSKCDSRPLSPPPPQSQSLQAHGQPDPTAKLNNDILRARAPGDMVHKHRGCRALTRHCNPRSRRGRAKSTKHRRSLIAPWTFSSVGSSL